MSEIAWADVREQAVIAFGGELPSAQVEADVIDAFTAHPRLVLAAIDEIAEEVAKGKVRSGWAVLRANLARLRTDDIRVHDTTDREQAIARAQAWLEVAGLYLEHPSQVEDALFGDARLHPRYTATVEQLEAIRDGMSDGARTMLAPLIDAHIERARQHGPEPIPGSGQGLLRPWADDDALRRAMLARWEALRERGEEAEREAERRQQAMRRPRPEPAETMDERVARLAVTMSDEEIQTWIAEHVADEDERIRLADLAADVRREVWATA